MLRHLLVQDFDLDADGAPETLRLMFARLGFGLRTGRASKSSARLLSSARLR